MKIIFLTGILQLGKKDFVREWGQNNKNRKIIDFQKISQKQIKRFYNNLQNRKLNDNSLSIKNLELTLLDLLKKAIIDAKASNKKEVMITYSVENIKKYSSFYNVTPINQKKIKEALNDFDLFLEENFKNIVFETVLIKDDYDEISKRVADLQIEGFYFKESDLKNLYDLFYKKGV